MRARALTIATLSALTILLSATRSEAGAQDQSASCYLNSDYSGGCYGTFLGFRNSSQPNASVSFDAGTNWQSFVANFNSTFFSCSVPAGSTMSTLWPQFMGARGYFSIFWNASGQCTWGYVLNSSIYSSY